MSSKIYKVFLSSTFKDLEAERKRVIEGLLFMNCMPVAMEFFPASDKKPADLIKSRMKDCDYYILIIKGKYGSIDADTGKSFTEMEYDYAIENNIPILGFTYANPNNLKVSEVDVSDESKNQLKKFIANASMRTVKSWKSTETLIARITETLHDQFNDNPRQGFIKENKNDVAPGIKTLDEIETQKEKIGYIKFLHLSRAENTNGTPLYKRYISRLNKSIDVFDELILFSINAFDEEISGFERTDLTLGVVDFNILYPWQPYLSNPKGTVLDGSLNQPFQKSSEVFLTASYFFNSFQKDQTFRITMEKPTRSAIFIFDFSFLSGHESFIEIEKVSAWLEYTDIKTILEVNTKIPRFNTMVNTSGIYWVSAENLKKETAIIFDFTAAINWDKL